MVRAVNEAVDEIEYTEGWLDFDNVDFRRGGVYITLYDNDGFRIAGFAPDEVPYTAFSDGILRTLTSGRNSWYIYDSQLSFSDEDSIWVRGIIGSYDMRAVVSSMQGVLLIVLPLLVLMAALGGYVIVKRSFRPIDKIIKSFNTIISSLGIEEIAVNVGDDFDESVAEAIMNVPAEEGQKPNAVARVLKKGYRQGGKVIRFAQVIVTI